MRKLLSNIFVLLAALVAVGCENDTPQESGVKFTFGEPNVSTDFIEVGVTCSDADANYYADIVKSADIASLTDAQIIENYITSPNAKLRKGFQIVAKNGLLPDTDYTVFVFAYGTTDKLTKLELRTEQATDPVPSDQFDVTIEVKDITANSATAIATPNTSANRYYFRVITKMELDAFGIYNDDYQVFEYIIENPNSGSYITSGTTTLNCNLLPETDYLAVAFNFENWENVHNKVENIKLFRYAFSTPKGEPVDPNSLFLTANLTTTHTNFSLDVTPAHGEDAHWTYYIWTKKSYDQTLANEASAAIVMRSYFGLNNLAVEQGYSFGDIIQTDKLGKRGSHTISAYQTLHNNTDYVVVLFYIDPTTTDPTVVTDYNYVAVEFTTSAPSDDIVASLEVSEPVVVRDGFKYNVNFLVKTNEYAEALLVGAQLWDNYDFAKYWDPNDWSQIQAFFMFRKPVEADTLAAAKTADGATISFPDVDSADYVFFFEVLNVENTATQFAVRVTPDYFENAQ